MSEDRSEKKSNVSLLKSKIAISRRRFLGSSSLIAASAVASTTLPRTAASQDANVLPKPEPPFQGRIGRTRPESTPDFPKMVEAPGGAPNILLILTDDVGFGASSTFGGPIQTPNFQRVADSGLRYNQYHTTALCSPTRAALLTGRNHHSVATGVITELGDGYPGYSGQIPKSTAMVSEALRQNGYSTAFIGKNHNIADWETSISGPYDRWPALQGFDHFYGFIGGEANQWAPALYRDNTPVEMDHMGIWFADPQDAANAGCSGISTPFDGDHNAGILVLSTANFPDDQGPLLQLRAIE